MSINEIIAKIVFIKYHLLSTQNSCHKMPLIHLYLKYLRNSIVYASIRYTLVHLIFKLIVK